MPRTIDEQAADTLTYLHDTAQRLRDQRDYNNADRVEISTSNVMEVFKKRGMICSCKYPNRATKYSRIYCSCRSTNGRKKTTQRAAFRGVYFDGEHCRDGEGAFVPVSQCMGPVGRDLVTGRYVSIK